MPFVTRWCRGKGGDVIIYVFRYIYSYHTGGTDLCYDQFHERALEVERHRRWRWPAVRTPIPWIYGKELKDEPRPDPTMRSSSLLAVRAGPLGPAVLLNVLIMHTIIHTILLTSVSSIGLWLSNIMPPGIVLLTWSLCIIKDG